MATNSVIPSVYVVQWYHGNYEAIHRCITELCRVVDARQMKDSHVPSEQAKNEGFWSRFWSRSKDTKAEASRSDRASDELSDNSCMAEDEEMGLDRDSVSWDYMVSDPGHVEISDETLDKLKAGVILGFRKSLFHHPHMIPRRNISISLEELRDNIRRRFPLMEKAAEQIDGFSALANVDQELCCEMLQEGICFYGEESQKLSENIIIENMLHAQSQYQLKSLMKLFSLFNSNMTVATDCVSDDHAFPESVDILRDLVSKGLLKNLCLLLMAAIKEASRHQPTLTGDKTEIGTALYEHSIETIHSVLSLLEMYFLRFHPMQDDIKCIMVLIPHVLRINELLGVNDYSRVMESLFNEVDNLSAWHPQSTSGTSFWIGVREFDDMTNRVCNVTNRLSLILMMSLHPHHYRLSISESSSGTIYASLMQDLHFLDRLKTLEKPFHAHNNLETIMEFIVFGMYHHDMERAIRCIDSGVFQFLGATMMDATPLSQRATVVQILDLMLSLFVLKEGVLNKNWYDIVDYEITCKRESEDRATMPFTGTIDEKVYREPGRSLMELINLLKKFGVYGERRYMVQIWKSCAEIYRSVVPNVNCHLYKFNAFENALYNCQDTDGIDQKTINRLVVPGTGFSWWERNNALLELVNITANEHGIYVETYPRYLTCVLQFGIFLSAFDLEGENGGHTIGEFLSTGASREMSFPFLLQRIICQIGSLTKDHYKNLPEHIYKRLLARDDQIETAEAAINIASSIPAQHSQQNTNVSGFMRRMYTFPFISNVREVKVALSTLGLGGICPYGLIETATAAFQLISQCDRISRSPSKITGAKLSLNVKMQYGTGDDQQGLLNAIFSILSRNHIKGTEMLISSVLASICSGHIKDAETATAALSRVAELLQDPESTLSRGFQQKKHKLSAEELRAFIKSLKNLFLFLPYKKRFNCSHIDWLQRLVEFALWILETQCFNNASVDWELISHVLEFLFEVAKGPIDTRDAKISTGSQYVLEQLLMPASTSCISLVRAANEAKLIPAISLICILFKRDVLLLLAHRASLYVPSRRVGDRCKHCGLPYVNETEELSRKLHSDMDVDGASGSFQWWSNKIRKINSIFSCNLSEEPEPKQPTCECIKIEMRPVSLLMAHDAVVEAMNALRGNSDVFMDGSTRCDFIGHFHESAPEELKIKCVYLLLQLQERMGVDCLTVPGRIVKDLQQYFSRVKTGEDLTRHVMHPYMEAVDLILYNQLSGIMANSNQEESAEHWYHCMSHLSDMNRCGLDNMVMFLLKQSAMKASVSKCGTNFGSQLLGSNPQIIALIRLASGGKNEPWRFSDYHRMDALASLLFFAKSSSHVRQLILTHWRGIEEEANKFDFSRLSYESYIIQCQRLSCLLELLVVLATQDNGSIVIGDLTDYVKLYSRFTNTMDELSGSMKAELEPMISNAVEGRNGLGITGFLKFWRSVSFQSNVCAPFDMQLSTKLLNPEAAQRYHKNMKNYALRMNCSNMVLASSTSVISCLLNFILRCSKYNISALNEKSRSWLKIASAEFNPDESSDLKLGLQIALIKHVSRVWLSSNNGISGNDSMLAISIIMKLVNFILTRKTSKQMRSKIYACVNLLLTNQSRADCPSTAELLVAHLLSPSLDMQKYAAQERQTLLQTLFKDARSLSKNPKTKKTASSIDNDTRHSIEECVVSGMEQSASSDMELEDGISIPKEGDYMAIDLYYNNIGMRQIFVGNDYSKMDPWEMRKTALRDLLELERSRSLEMIFIAADHGVPIDYRVEGLTFLATLTNALHRFEATSIEYDAGNVVYGSMGSITTEEVSGLIRSRFWQFRCCKQCELHLPCCPACLKLLTAAACALKAVSGLQQFSTFWFHVQPTAQSACLADRLLACNLLLGFNKLGSPPIELIYPFISILENLLYMPSVKTRNGLIQWTNRHAELLSSFLVLPEDGAPNEDRVYLICSLLRIYRVCILWLLAEYRSAKFQSEPMNNFSLIMADLQCKFPLAVSVPRCIPMLLETLTSKLRSTGEAYWQCILLCLQTIFPELGAFEADLDFSKQTPIMTLAIEKAQTILTVLTRCGSQLMKFINQIASSPPNIKRMALGRFALRASTVECATTLLEYILAMVLNHNTTGNTVSTMPQEQSYNDNSQECVPYRPRISDAMNSLSAMVPKLKQLVSDSKVESVLDKIANTCQEKGGSFDPSLGSRRKHIIGEQMVEHLAPYDLEHVASFGNAHQFKYSYNSLYALLLSSVCNVALVLEQYYGCKFSSSILSSHQLDR